MLDNILSMLQMMSGGNNNALGEMLKNIPQGADGNNMMSSLMSMLSNGGAGGNNNMTDMLKNMGGGESNNLLSMLPLLQMMMQNNKPKRKEEVKAEPVINEQKYYQLKPISKIANKDITYALNQYFAEA